MIMGGGYRLKCCCPHLRAAGCPLSTRRSAVSQPPPEGFPPPDDSPDPGARSGPSDPGQPSAADLRHPAASTGQYPAAPTPPGAYPPAVRTTAGVSGTARTGAGRLSARRRPGTSRDRHPATSRDRRPGTSRVHHPGTSRDRRPATSRARHRRQPGQPAPGQYGPTAGLRPTGRPAARLRTAGRLRPAAGTPPATVRRRVHPGIRPAAGSPIRRPPAARRSRRLTSPRSASPAGVCSVRRC